ncbi:MAG: DUF523 domain-containing protein [Christensenellales bacterium]
MDVNILVSACLLGAACRYDGRAKPDDAALALAKRHNLIPVCPEIYGGLPTPREPAEMREGRVYRRCGADVTQEFARGARETLRIARTLGCTAAVLKDGSPSCGKGLIHNGRFDGGYVAGDGMTARILEENGIRVIAASEFSGLSADEIDAILSG